MNAKATKEPKTTKFARSSNRPNPQESPQAAPDPTNAQPANPPAPDAPVAPESAQVAKRGKRPKGEATLEDVFTGYLDSLEKADKSEGTIFSYRMDLKAALDHFGEDAATSTLTTTKVSNFFASDGVTKKRNGKKRSEITIAKTRRVFRLALVWAAESGMIERAPIPADELEHARGTAKQESPKPSKAAKATRATKKAKAVDPIAADETSTPEPAAATPTE